MARKNLIEISTPLSATDENPQRTDGRPIAGQIPVLRSGSPVGGITKALGNITEKMEHAKVLERQLAEGQTVVELDPALVDASFVNDRLEVDIAGLAELTEQIRVHGQQVPILVRPHPEQRGRFQVAYGHRRLAAIKSLGIKVRAVVRNLTDDELVVSQGQENNARTNLSYIERTLFAFRLEERGFRRDVITAALGVDKAALSKMLIIMSKVPLDIIKAIGPAPSIGRRRWMELGELLNGFISADLMEKLSADYLASVTSDQRFQQALHTASNRTNERNNSPVEDAVGSPVRIKRTKATTSFVFDTKSAPGFDNFVQQKLKGLFAEFNQLKGT